MQAGRVAVLVVEKLDSLTRSVADLERLIDMFERHDCRLMSADESIDTGSAAGRMAVRMLRTLAQWERETIAVDEYGLAKPVGRLTPC